MSITAEQEKNGVLTILVEGRVDTGNASETEAQIRAEIEKAPKASVVIDCEKLEYISSAGLRVILRLKKNRPELKLINASSEIYEIFDMTGFTEMMTIEKAYKTVSVEGCEIIGEGSNGIVYRTDPETIVKVYRDPDSLDDILHEREVARKALILGIPTAISYDVVRVGESYASRFELISAKSFTKLINANPDKIDAYIDMYVELLKHIHSTVVPAGDLPDQKKVVLGWVEWLKGHIPDEQYEKILALVEAVPETDHMIHGDYHTKNLMLQDDEVIMIDMDTLSTGDPVFEFGPIFLAYRGFGELDHSAVTNFIGISWEQAQYIWQETLQRHLGTEDKEFLQKAENKAKLIGYIRMLRRTMKRTPDNTELIAHCRKNIDELLPTINTLTFLD